MQNTNPANVPQISVLLCCYNRAAKAGRCLDALQRQTIGRELYEVVCVNDGSTDETGNVMKDALTRLPGTYCEHERNKALAAARNTAIRASHGEYLLFINDDTYPAPDFLEQHLLAHSCHPPEVAVLGHIPFIPELKQRLFSVMLFEYDLYFPFYSMRPHVDYPYLYFITGNISIRREMFLQHDIWFDESFIRYGYEDIECGYRLNAHGLKVYYNPKARVAHDHLINVDDFIRREQNNSVNCLQFAAKYQDPVLAKTLLGTVAVTNTTVAGWQKYVEEHAGEIDALTGGVREVEDLVLAPSTAEEAKAAMALVAQTAQSVRAIARFYRRKTFLQTLDQYPEMRAKLEKIQETKK